MRILPVAALVLSALALQAEAPPVLCHSPELVLRYNDGHHALLSSYRGKVIGLLFVHTTCPHCQQVLNPLAPIVVATRNCPGCGRQVLAEPEGNDSPSAFTLEQLDDAHAAHKRAQSRAWGIIDCPGWAPRRTRAVPCAASRFFWEILTASSVRRPAMSRMAVQARAT